MGRVEIFALKTHGILKSKMITLRAFNSTKVKVICLLFFSKLKFHNLSDNNGLTDHSIACTKHKKGLS